jgi:dTDP-4-dehydrorhamnose 3,5-epimerase
MIFEPTPLPGLLVVRPEKHADRRGFFARLWCEQEFAAAGVPFRPQQISVSSSTVAGTLRGLHWQAPPHGEIKLVRVISGQVFDVAVDLRPGSSTRCQWFGLELDADNCTALLIPAGFAHGFITLTDGTELLYCIDAAYAPAASCGARYDDPMFGIVWPRPPAVIDARDLNWPPLHSVPGATPPGLG